jgi:hypothetical protein
MTGKYVGQGISSPNSFIGIGETEFIGTGFMLGNWNGFKDNERKEKTWNGEMAGISISVPIDRLTEKLKSLLKIVFNTIGEISKGAVETDTKIQYPTISTTTQQIFDEYYDKKSR